jgi:hypothetical protein
MRAIVFNFNRPNLPFQVPHIPGFGSLGTKVISIAAAVLICGSMVFFAIFTVLTNNKSYVASHNIATAGSKVPASTSGSSKNKAALPGGGIAVGVGGTTGTNSPVVTLTADPASVTIGKTAVLKWSVTNNPNSCVASEDWTGNKSPSGSETTAPLTKLQTYLFTLTCKTKTGTGFATVSVGAIAQGGSGNVATRPAVKLAANPTSIYTNDSSTLTWSVTNNPTSCTASGDWSGAKSNGGAESTGQLTSAKNYTYTLTCSNGAGSGFATSTVAVVNPPPNLPIVTIASNPIGPVTPGSAVTLTWATTNNPSSCNASGDWSGGKAGSGSQSSGPLNSIRTYTFTITCSNQTGGTFDSAAIQVLPNPPSVSLTVSPSSITVGNHSTLTWSSTNSPTSCTASGDWSGAKTANGTQSTGTLNTAGTYVYNLSCTNAGGSGFMKNVALTVALPPAPVINLSANPISVTTGNSSTLTWSVTNSPTSCTASGDWSGSKAASGTQSTGTLNTVKTYSYTLNCSNAGGSDSATTTVGVSSGGGGAVAPVVTISVAPSPIGTGSSSTISWSATNNPTSCTASGSWSGAKAGSGSTSTGPMNSAGTFTYSLSCSNSAGSGSSSASLTVIAIPVVTISVSPASINTGSSATITWSATNNPTSCTAGGSWTGSKGASGSQSTGTMNTAGSYNYSLSCTNSGGTGSNSAALTVSAPGPVYCAGKTPCYGPSDLASRSSPGNCWGWNLDWVINITSFRPHHPGGIDKSASSTIENSSATCNHDLHAILSGTAGIPGFVDGNGNTSHKHGSDTINNTPSGNNQSQLAAYRVGYYDSSKP